MDTQHSCLQCVGTFVDNTTTTFMNNNNIIIYQEHINKYKIKQNNSTIKSQNK